jgi:hypothetical protein
MSIRICAIAAVMLFCGPVFADPPTDIEIMAKAISPDQVASNLKRFVAVDLGVDEGRISDEHKAVLLPLWQAAKAVDDIYWHQISPNGLEMYKALRASRTTEGRRLARYLSIQYGPWDRHQGDQPIIGRWTRPPGANFYPRDISLREIDAWVQAHPGDTANIWSPYTVLSRQGKKLIATPYSKKYAKELKVAAAALRKAAASTPCHGLARFLEERARSFMDDDYRKSEVLWLETGDCPLDVAIGPYEYYDDRLVGVKTAFEAIIYYRDDKQSERYKRFLSHYDDLVTNLPVSPAVRERFYTAKPTPITIADVLYTAGDARAGYQIRAFILPNDESVRRAKGTKKVILRNVAKAKFDNLARPVAARVFGKKMAKELSFDAYFDLLLSWQLAHSLVPGPIELPGGGKVSTRNQLRVRHTFIDSLRGEVIALLNYFHLVEKGALKQRSKNAMAVTYLTNLFDSARLAEGTPQTLAKTIVYNYLARHWVFRYNPHSATFEVNSPAMPGAVRKLAAETLEILARGDYDGAGRLIVQYGIMPGEMRQKLTTMSDLPLDILPNYVSMPRGDAHAIR